ncbi:MAG: TonB family protein, partial [Deltaproteobacteria bacterium]|nr:TonB family protein [Deltaproteobacteria bacterium]
SAAGSNEGSAGSGAGAGTAAANPGSAAEPPTRAGSGSSSRKPPAGGGSGSSGRKPPGGGGSEPAVTPPPKGGKCSMDEVGCLLAEHPPACCSIYGGKGGGGGGGGTSKPPVGGGGGGGGGDSDLPEELDRAAISAGVGNVKSRILGCGDKSSAKGEVKVSVKVSPSGSVSSVSVKNTPDAALGSCVASAIQKASFKKTQKGGSFSYPFIFR